MSKKGASALSAHVSCPSSTSERIREPGTGRSSPTLKNEKKDYSPAIIGNRNSCNLSLSPTGSSSR